MKRKVIGCQSRGCHIRCFSVISAHIRTRARLAALTPSQRRDTSTRRDMLMV
jgi:hypothetical protein